MAVVKERVKKPEERPRVRIPVMLLTYGSMQAMGRRLRGLGRVILTLQPRLRETLPKLGLEIEPEGYAASSLISSFFYGFIFFLITFVAFTLRSDSTFPPDQILHISIAIGIGIWSVFLLLHLIYPGIVIRKVAAKETKDLLFALREIMMNVESGVPLFDAMKNVARGNYGYISKDFEKIVKDIEGGVPEREALRQLAISTESEFLKRAVWQLVNALESGASISSALPSIIDSLEGQTYRDIRGYSSNLNFLMLIYMISAAVVPSMGITFLVLLSAFSSFGVDIQTISTLVAVSGVIQLVMIGYMSSTRPEIFGG